MCSPCHYKCSSCTGLFDNCLGCWGVGRLNNFPMCDCDVGYWDDGNKDCASCPS